MTAAHGQAVSPAVTIGMPLYNDATYVSKALDSLLAQTFTDFEIVISDNASTDLSPSICEDYAKRDSRIRYVRQPHNIGVRDNFVSLWEGAQGEFFMWAASDDKWHPEFLQTCVDALRRDPGAALAFGPFAYIDEDGGAIGGTQDFDFSGSSPFGRLLRLNASFDEGRDAIWYGLYRRAVVGQLRVRYWWSINSSILVNTAYPVLTYVLMRGNFAHAGHAQPLWLNRLHTRSGSRHSGAFRRRPATAAAAFLLRQLNMICYCVDEVFRARKSVALAAAAIPVLVLRAGAEIVVGSLRMSRLVVRKLQKMAMGG